MITTNERIQLLAEACALPCVEALMGEITAHDLSLWLEAELGNPSALDSFNPHGDLLSRAYAPECILHIVSGNTAHAAIQSVIRGLLLGSHNIIKLPSVGLPAFSECMLQFPANLKELIETHDTLTDELMSKIELLRSTT